MPLLSTFPADCISCGEVKLFTYTERRGKMKRGKKAAIRQAKRLKRLEALKH